MSSKGKQHTYKGKTLSLKDWSNETGIGLPTLYYRLNSGMTIKQAIETPVADKRYSRDLTGRTFGNLTVLERVESRKNQIYKCKCSCGKERVVAAHYLRTGEAKHCSKLRCPHSSYNKPALHIVKNNGLFQLRMYDKNTKKGKYIASYKTEELALQAKEFYLENGYIKPNEVVNNNTSGHRSVSWCSKRNMWRAYKWNPELKKQKWLGYHKAIEDAIQAVLDYERELEAA